MDDEQTETSEATSPTCAGSSTTPSGDERTPSRPRALATTR